jgi:hypothetical protein
MTIMGRLAAAALLVALAPVPVFATEPEPYGCLDAPTGTAASISPFTASPPACLVKALTIHCPFPSQNLKPYPFGQTQF